MKKLIFILNVALFFLFVFCMCTSKVKENEDSITKCKLLLKQAETSPISEFPLPLGLKFGISEKEVYKIMNCNITTKKVSMVDSVFHPFKYEPGRHNFSELNHAYYVNFTPSSIPFKSTISFSFRDDSLYELRFTVGDTYNYGLNFSSDKKNILIQELTKSFPNYNFFSCKLGFVEKKDPDTFKERDFWIKNNIVICLKFDPYDNRCSVAYTNTPLSTLLTPLNSFEIDLNPNKKIDDNNLKPENTNINDKTAIEEIRKEPKVIEALLTDANVLYVSVMDDGTRRDGFAVYLCQIIKEHNSTINCVKVVKVNSTKDPNRDNAYGVLLGESYCK